MRAYYFMRALGVRRLAGPWPPSVDRPVNKHSKDHQVIQEENNDEGGADRVTHSALYPLH